MNDYNNVDMCCDRSNCWSSIYLQWNQTVARANNFSKQSNKSEKL